MKCVVCVCVRKDYQQTTIVNKRGPNQCGCSCCRPLSHLMNTTGRETDLLCQHTQTQSDFHTLYNAVWMKWDSRCRAIVQSNRQQATAGNSVHSSHTFPPFLPGNNICIAHTQSICAVQMRYLHLHHHHWVFLSVSPKHTHFPLFFFRCGDRWCIDHQQFSAVTTAIATIATTTVSPIICSHYHDHLLN